MMAVIFSGSTARLKQTEAYQDLKPLFDRELELIEMEDWEQFEKTCQQIRNLGL